jgi:geranylgeranyl diphosphate synthase type II
MEFKSWFKEKVRIVDEYLEKVIEEKENPQKIIYEAMNYSLLSGGKRLRPLLLMGSYELFKDDLKEALPYACYVEDLYIIVSVVFFYNINYCLV